MARPPSSAPETKPRGRYHHGDLRAALLEAGERVLAETGVEGFSLRRVAREVGVSHAAPAHHFGDTRGLLTALAAEGFRRFLAAMQARQAALEGAAAGDPAERLLASGLGYVDFAEGAPALFRLMFATTDATEETPELAAAGDAAFLHLVADVARLRGRSAFEDEAVMAETMAAWSLAHGFAELLISGRMKPVQGLDGAQRDAFMRAMFAPLVERRT